MTSDVTTTSDEPNLDSARRFRWYKRLSNSALTALSIGLLIAGPRLLRGVPLTASMTAFVANGLLLWYLRVKRNESFKAAARNRPIVAMGMWSLLLSALGWLAAACWCDLHPGVSLVAAGLSFVMAFRLEATIRADANQLDFEAHWARLEAFDEPVPHSKVA